MQSHVSSYKHATMGLILKIMAEERSGIEYEFLSASDTQVEEITYKPIASVEAIQVAAARDIF